MQGLPGTGWAGASRSWQMEEAVGGRARVAGESRARGRCVWKDVLCSCWGDSMCCLRGPCLFSGGQWL